MAALPAPRLGGLLVDATNEVELYFLPCEHLAASVPGQQGAVLLAWSEPALALLLGGTSRLGRPQQTEVVEHAKGDLVFSSAGSRVSRSTLLSARVLPGGRLLARACHVSTRSPAEFPSQRAYDSVSAIARARWTLHNRVSLLVDCAQELGGPEGQGGPPSTVVYLRVQNGKDVDQVALQRAVDRAVADVWAVLA